MFPDLAGKYPSHLLAEREQVATKGSFRDRVRYDLVARPNYAFGLLAAADVAKFSGIKKITAIEFGVAEGNGLLNMCELAPQIAKTTGVEIEVVGFDTGIGLPELTDYRDHPEVWQKGDFANPDRQLLLSKLPPFARIVWGDIAETLKEFTEQLTEKAPVGFVSIDVDMYASTVSALELFKIDARKLLPVTICYFDDTLGAPSRIGSLFRNRWAGQLLAIDEFNALSLPRKLDIVRTLKARRPLDKELWLDQIYGLHALDHPLRQVGYKRPALSMGEHGGTNTFEWLL